MAAPAFNANTPCRCGFFNIGTLAGEVDNPKKVFPLVLMILAPVVFLQVCIA